MSLQHGNSLVHGECNLVSDRDQAFGQSLVVLHQQSNGQHEIINVVEDNGVLVCVCLLRLVERNWVLTPVSKRVEVMRGVVTIVVAEAVALLVVSICLAVAFRESEDLRQRRSM